MSIIKEKGIDIGGKKDSDKNESSTKQNKRIGKVIIKEYKNRDTLEIDIEEIIREVKRELFNE